MGLGISKKAVVLLLVLVSFRSFGSDTETVDTNAEVSTAMASMQEKKADLSVNSEVADLDKEDYEETEKQAIVELRKLDSEVRELEHQVASLNKGAESSRLKAELAAKKLELRQRERSEVAKKEALAERTKKQADSRKEQASKRLQAMEQQLTQIRQKNHETSEGIRTAEKENAQLKLRLEKAKRSLALEQKRREAMKAKRTHVSQDGKHLKSELSRIEKASS